jgi:hypothetical protein
MFPDAPSPKIGHIAYRLTLGSVMSPRWEVGQHLLLELAQASLQMSTDTFSLDEIKQACAYLVEKGLLRAISTDEWEILRAT